MEHFFVEQLGFSETVFSFVLLPVLIFLARICDVSINTIRIIYMLGGRRFTSTLLGFFESFIWLMAIRQIFEHLDNWVCYVAYPAGFASGVFVGMIIEERIAYGKVIVRIITRKSVAPLIQYLNEHHYRHTCVDAEGPNGKENLVFTVLERDRLDTLLETLRALIPTAFYTIERVKAAAETNAIAEEPGRFRLFNWMRGVMRT